MAGCASQDRVLTSAASKPSGDFITVDGVALHYRILGAGPKAVALHGASGNLLDWSVGPARRLAKTNQVLLFDRPGLGFSARPRRDGDNLFVQARLMRRAAAELGFGRAAVIGHSFGGAVALAWALDAPEAVSGLLLLGTPSQVWPGGVGLLYDLTGNPVTGPVVSRLLPALASDRLIRDAVTRVFAPQAAPPGYAEAVGADLALLPRNLRANAADVGNLKTHIRGMVPRYGALTMPVEILHGTADAIVPITVHSEPLARQIAGARFTPLAGIGHMPHHAAPKALSAALARLNAQA